MAKAKREIVTASFHYLMRKTKDDQGGATLRPFSHDEFKVLASTLAKLPEFDRKCPDRLEQLKFRETAIISNVHVINDRSVFGTYEAGYSGHAYDNTHVGIVPAESISLRRFCFVLYFGESGKIYLGSQYLGTFGGYGAIENTIKTFLSNADDVASLSVRLDGVRYQNLIPTEVKVAIARPSKSSTGENSFASRVAVTFKREDRKDINFSDNVIRRLLPGSLSDGQAVKAAVAKLINETELMAIDDDDIIDCAVIGMIGRRKKTIHLIESGLFATKFELNVNLDSDGLPLLKQATEEMFRTLETYVLRRSELI